MYGKLCVLTLMAVQLMKLTDANTVPAERNGELFELLILHNNDMHARFEQTAARSGPCVEGERCYGGFARVAHL